MNIKKILSVFLILIASYLFSQEELFLAYTISPELIKNANAVVRQDKTVIEISAYNRMNVTTKRIVTIFNSQGDQKHGGVIGYDNNTTIKKLEAKIYDALGNEIKKIKKNDFEDVSAVDGGTLYSDSRVKYLDYTPINYPYTVELEQEVEYRSTAFVPGWIPIEGFYISTENAEYEIINSTEIEVKTKTLNFEDYNIEKHNDFHYTARNLEAIKPESYSPPFKNYAPYLYSAMTVFDMEGVKGVNQNWNDFGKWMYENLIKGTQELPEEVKQEIRILTADAKNDLEKAKIVYEYMQSKTRYISVQVGIGGWKPMLASDVDRLGYGDCKGLSNYTKALLDEVDVESYYTVIHRDWDIVNIDKEFSRIEGNHVILTLPVGDSYMWLECTGQTDPFSYIATGTDDRDALIVTPEGGKIIHTKAYTTSENLQETKAKVKLDTDGNINAEVNIKSSGTQYGDHEGLQIEIEKDQKLHYKEYWDNINNLNIESMEFNNDKDNIVFTEDVQIKAEKYASVSGDRILLEPNIFNKTTYSPPRYRTRKLPFEIDRGFTDIDEFEITLPPELEVDALQEDINIINKFGEYSFSITKLDDNKLLYKRKFVQNKGAYKKEDYKAFRQFRLNVVKHDKSKIVLKQKS